MSRVRRREESWRDVYRMRTRWGKRWPVMVPLEDGATHEWK